MGISYYFFLFSVFYKELFVPLFFAINFFRRNPSPSPSPSPKGKGKGKGTGKGMGTSTRMKRFTVKQRI